MKLALGTSCLVISFQTAKQISSYLLEVEKAQHQATSGQLSKIRVTGAMKPVVVFQGHHQLSQPYQGFGKKP